MGLATAKGLDVIVKTQIRRDGVLTVWCAQHDETTLAPAWARGAAFLFRHGEMLYGFGGLRSYKAKFATHWEPRYIAGPRGMAFAQAIIFRGAGIDIVWPEFAAVAAS